MSNDDRSAVEAAHDYSVVLRLHELAEHAVSDLGRQPRGYGYTGSPGVAAAFVVLVRAVLRGRSQADTIRDAVAAFDHAETEECAALERQVAEQARRVATRRESVSQPCPTCDAYAGAGCVTAAGRAAAMPHHARMRAVADHDGGP